MTAEASSPTGVSDSVRSSVPLQAVGAKHPIESGALAGVALFGLNDVSNAELQRSLAHSAEIGRQQTAAQNNALAEVEEWPDQNAMSAAVTGFIDQRITAMNLQSLDGLVFFAAESHNSKTCVEVLETAMHHLHRLAAQAPQPPRISYLCEAQPSAMPSLEERACSLRRMLDATPDAPLHARGLLALEVAASPHKDSRQRTLTAMKVASAQRRDMQTIGFDGDRTQFQHLPYEHRQAAIDQQMATSIWQHRQREGGILIVSIGPNHVGKVFRALSAATPLMGLSPVGGLSPAQNAFILSESNLLPYRDSHALEIAWLHHMQPADAGPGPAVMQHGLPNQQTVVQQSDDLNRTVDSADRNLILSRIQAALAQSSAPGPARESIFRGLIQAVGQQGRLVLDESQLAWTRCLCDAMLYESPPVTQSERAAVAQLLASGICSSPPFHGEAIYTNAWALARLHKLAQHPFGAGRQAVLQTVMSALARRPSFLNVEDSKSQVVSLIERLMPPQPNEITQAIAGQLRGDPRIAGYLGADLDAKLQLALSNVPLDDVRQGDR